MTRFDLPDLFDDSFVRIGSVLLARWIVAWSFGWWVGLREEMMGCGDVFGGMDPLMQDWFLNLEMRGLDLDLGLGLLRYFHRPWRRIRRLVGKMLVGQGQLSLGLRVESLIWGVRGLRLRMIRG